MSEYRHGISEKIETIWGESWEKKDGLTGKFRLKGTSRDHLVQIAAANKVNFKMLFMVLARPVLKFPVLQSLQDLKKIQEIGTCL